MLNNTANNVVPTLEDLIRKLEAGGLEKYAFQVKKAFHQAFPYERQGPLNYRQRMPRYKQVQPPQSVTPSGSQEPFAERGEEVIDLPSGKMKRHNFPGYNDVKELPQLIDYMNKGWFDVDFLRDQLDKANTPQQKQHIQTLIDTAVKRQSMKCAAEKLLEVSKRSRGMGRDETADSLEAVALGVMAAAVPERHTVASLEEVYQKSQSSQDWSKNLKKVRDVYAGVASIIDMFIKTYRQTSHQLSQGEIKQDEAEKLMSLLRDTDRQISLKFKELDNEISK